MGGHIAESRTAELIEFKLDPSLPAPIFFMLVT